MDFAGTLEEGRRDFLDAVRGISAKEASASPGRGRWSVLECIEHTIAVEDRWLRRIARGAGVRPRRDSSKEMRIFLTVRNRETRIEAPDAFRPRGRLESLAAALSEFNAVRDRSVEWARARSGVLHAISARHRHFGDLNAAEWLQLIDAHARRHADQIRETSEMLRKPKAKLPVTTPPDVFRRDPPDLPAEFESGGAPFTGDTVAIDEQHLQETDAANLKLAELNVEGSILERVRLAGCEFGAAVWKDARFIGCDLANIRAHRIVLVRVELIDCRLTGLATRALEWQHVLVRNGDMSYVQLSEAKFRGCEFERTNWQEADAQNADFSGSVFRGCHLARADFRGAKLHNTDFRTSEMEGLIVGVNDLRGAIVDPAQAMILARVLGLQIR